jgi:ribosomal protein L33
MIIIIIIITIIIIIIIIITNHTPIIIIFIIINHIIILAKTLALKLLSTAGTGFFYVTTKNPRNVTRKLSLKKVLSSSSLSS